MISTQNGRLFGYARVSTNDQELNLQVVALVAHGVGRHFGPARTGLLCSDARNPSIGWHLLRSALPGLGKSRFTLGRQPYFLVWPAKIMASGGVN